MSSLLELAVGTESVDRAEVDLVVAGFFADERPLRGAAGRADWRLCGLISQQLEAERLRGDPGEAALLATSGRLAAPRVLALGLGERAHFGRDDVRSHTRDAVSRAVKLGVGSIALAPRGLSAAGHPGSTAAGGAGPSGGSEISELADEIASAALDTLRSVGASLRILLLVERDQAAALRRSLAEALAGSCEVRLEGAKESSSGSALAAAAPMV